MTEATTKRTAEDTPEAIAPADDAPDNGQVDDRAEGLDDRAILTVKRGYRSRNGRIEFAGPWLGLWVEANINPKRKLWRRLSDNVDVDAALCEVITDHNLIAEDGVPLGHPLTEDDIGELAYGLHVSLLREYVALVNKAAGVGKP